MRCSFQRSGHDQSLPVDPLPKLPWWIAPRTTALCRSDAERGTIVVVTSRNHRKRYGVLRSSKAFTLATRYTLSTMGRLYQNPRLHTPLSPLKTRSFTPRKLRFELCRNLQFLKRL